MKLVNLCLEVFLLLLGDLLLDLEYPLRPLLRLLLLGLHIGRFLLILLNDVEAEVELDTIPIKALEA